MELNIGAKILELRKAKNVTQQQLAEAAGVSIAAVSKWECAASYPDIMMLPVIANYFHVSVDALMDYEVKPDNLQQSREELQVFVQAADYKSGLPVAERALKQYPNDFQLLLSMAQLKLSEGTSGSCPDKRATVEKAIDYWNRALVVRPSNSPISKEAILQNIAFAYGSIHEYKKANALLEEMNTNGVFGSDIAYNLIELGKFDEAKVRLQDHLFRMAFGFASVTDSLGKCFREEGALEYTVDLQRMHAQFLASFSHDKPNYCDLICSISYLELAKLQLETEDEAGMWESIDKSVYYAVRFDQQPSYAQSSVKFMDNCEGWLWNSSSQHAGYGVIRGLQSNFSKFQGDARYESVISKLEAASRDKRESGMWE